MYSTIFVVARSGTTLTWVGYRGRPGRLELGFC